MKKEVVWGRASHHFFARPQDESFKGNQCDRTLKMDETTFKGPYTSCAGSKAYLDWTYKNIGPFIVMEGPSYGFIKSRPHYGFTTKVRGLWIFGWLIVGGISYDFRSKGKNERPWGLQILRMKLQDATSMRFPTIRKGMGIPADQELIVDPHLKK